MRQAFIQGWRPAQGDLLAAGFQPARDVGPLPHIWIPPSSAEAWLVGAPAAGSGDAPSIAVGAPLTWTQPVVAVPTSLVPQLRLPQNGLGDGWSWATLLKAFQRTGTHLVRPAPTSSGVGLLHTIALYSALNNSELVIRKQEDDIREQVRRDGYHAGEDGDILCSYQDAAKPGPVALLVSDRTLKQFPRQGCGDPDAPVGRAELTGLPLKGVPGLDHPFVTVRWPGASRAGELDEAVRDFEGWLRTDRDTATRLASTAGIPADREQTRTAMRTYTRVQVRGRVLLAVDISQLMTEQTGDPAAGVPLEAAAAAISRASSLLGADDEIGLLTFAATGPGRGVHLDTPIPVSPARDRSGDRRAKLAAWAAQAEPHADGSPLFDAIITGHQIVAGGRQTGVAALVVLADGRTGGDIVGSKATALRNRLDALQGDAATVPVYVLAFHGGACGLLSPILKETVGGSCQVTSPATVVDDLRNTLAGLWKGTP